MNNTHTPTLTNNCTLFVALQYHMMLTKVNKTTL